MHRYNASLLVWFQGLPTIPEKISNETLLAILFVFVVFLAFGLILAQLVLRSLPRLVDPIAAAIRYYADQLMLTRDELARVKAEVDKARDSSEAVREHIHDRITPILSGNTIAVLRVLGLGDLGDRLEHDNPDAAIPKHRERKDR